MKNFKIISLEGRIEVKRFLEKMSFQNKVVIVTGASSGIGAATAKIFAKEKAKVVIVGRNTEKLGNVAADIKKTTGVEPLVIKADVADDGEARGVVDKTISQYHKLDVLVNNAGITGYMSILDEKYISEFDRIMATNLRGVAVITHAAIPHLIKTKGNIVNVSSIASFNVRSKLSHYGASKAALDQFSKCIALELAPKGVRVNVVNPGPVSTDIILTFGVSKEQSDAMFKKIAESTPLKIVSESEEIGDVILFLASDKAKSVTGSSYTIDCGNSLIGETDHFN